MQTLKKVGAGKKRRTRTVKGHYEDLFLPSLTPVSIRKISAQIAKDIESKSYSPSLNRKLVQFESISRANIESCNFEEAFYGREPLGINIEESDFEHNTPIVNCYSYYDEKVIKLLLQNLKANRRIDPYRIITPVQSEHNCWFNVFFVLLFISDKGRKFFHFFRELMIKGVNVNGEELPVEIRDSFALLNFAIEQCLTGNELAYSIDTNVIIKSIYDVIPDKSNIMNVGENGNPIQYYFGIMGYLNNNDMQLFIVDSENLNYKLDWKSYISKEIYSHDIGRTVRLPNIIIFSILKNHANSMKKAARFTINKAIYQLDSACIIDTKRKHFCATITCNGEEMAYNGASFNSLVPMKWKHNINRDVSWGFAEDIEKWNFTKCYQILMYYRVK